MAQVGSRLIDAAAGKIAEDFFKAFEAHLLAASGGVVPPAAEPAAAGGNKTLWIAVGVVVALVVLYFALR
jgi:hypothetical protein